MRPHEKHYGFATWKGRKLEDLSKNELRQVVEQMDARLPRKSIAARHVDDKTTRYELYNVINELDKQYRLQLSQDERLAIVQEEERHKARQERIAGQWLFMVQLLLLAVLVLGLIALAIRFMPSNPNKFAAECEKRGAFYLTNCKH